MSLHSHAQSCKLKSRRYERWNSIPYDCTCLSHLHFPFDWIIVSFTVSIFFFFLFHFYLLRRRLLLAFRYRSLHNCYHQASVRSRGECERLCVCVRLWCLCMLEARNRRRWEQKGVEWMTVYNIHLCVSLHTFTKYLPLSREIHIFDIRSEFGSAWMDGMERRQRRTTANGQRRPQHAFISMPPISQEMLCTAQRKRSISIFVVFASLSLCVRVFASIHMYAVPWIRKQTNTEESIGGEIHLDFNSHGQKGNVFFRSVTDVRRANIERPTKKTRTNTRTRARARVHTHESSRTTYGLCRFTMVFGLIHSSVPFDVVRRGCRRRCRRDYATMYNTAASLRTYEYK